ncbi:MAG TPA: hypothetical protein ENL18_03210 [Thermoplasmatales archaeon]|nr:hypothetical protein [Thermoplasmatales archaeon]
MKIRTVILVTLLLTISTAPFHYDGMASQAPNSKTDILYVGGTGPGNYSTIQAAVDAANSGDTVFVYDESSPYLENINISKPISVIGENRYTTEIRSNPEQDNIVIYCDNAYVANFNLTTEESGAGGISIEGSYNTVVNCTIFGNDSGYGGFFISTRFSNHTAESSSSNNISHCIITDSYGVLVLDSDNNMFYRNTFSNNYGFILILSNNTVVSQNNFLHKQERYVRFVMSYRNKWSGNYWERTFVSLPKVLLGIQLIIIGNKLSVAYPGIQFDWNPAHTPYDW